MTTTLAMISATQKKGPLGSEPNFPTPGSPLSLYFRRGSTAARNPSPSDKVWWHFRQIWGTWWVSGEGARKSVGILRQPPSVSLQRSFSSSLIKLSIICSTDEAFVDGWIISEMQVDLTSDDLQQLGQDRGWCHTHSRTRNLRVWPN